MRGRPLSGGVANRAKNYCGNRFQVVKVQALDREYWVAIYRRGLVDVFGEYQKVFIEHVDDSQKGGHVHRVIPEWNADISFELLERHPVCFFLSWMQAAACTQDNIFSPPQTKRHVTGNKKANSHLHLIWPREKASADREAALSAHLSVCGNRSAVRIDRCGRPLLGSRAGLCCAVE